MRAESIFKFLTLFLFLVFAPACKSEPPVDIETPPEANMDPAVAFPKFDVVYRHAGYMAGENSQFVGQLVVRYFRFFEDGRVRSESLMTTKSRKVTAAMNREAFKKLGLDSNERNILEGPYRISDGKIALLVEDDFVHKGRPGKTRIAYRGDIIGNQFKAQRFDPTTKERMSPFTVFWPVSP